MRRFHCRDNLELKWLGMMMMVEADQCMSCFRDDSIRSSRGHQIRRFVCVWCVLCFPPSIPCLDPLPPSLLHPPFFPWALIPFAERFTSLRGILVMAAFCPAPLLGLEDALAKIPSAPVGQITYTSPEEEKGNQRATEDLVSRCVMDAMSFLSIGNFACVQSAGQSGRLRNLEHLRHAMTLTPASRITSSTTHPHNFRKTAAAYECTAGPSRDR